MRSSIKRTGTQVTGWILLSQLIAATGFAADLAPPCLAGGRVLPEIDAQVLQWKVSTPNQFRARAHVHGIVDRLFSDEHGHAHFEIQIGPSPSDTLEVIYNLDFGALPQIQVGMDVEACGDYITSTAQAGPYPASPSGAIIHWIHTNPSGHGHESGYLMIDGSLYGMDGRSGSMSPLR